MVGGLSVFRFSVTDSPANQFSGCMDRQDKSRTRLTFLELLLLLLSLVVVVVAAVVAVESCGDNDVDA